MRRIASVVLIALVLAACGGGDDDADDEDVLFVATEAVAAATTAGDGSATEGSTAADATATESSGGEMTGAEGAPTHASHDFPDVQVPLEAGSSGEVTSMDPDPFAGSDSRNEDSKVRVTINEILDPAEIEGSIIAPEPGNRWWAVNITIEATGSEIANTGEWWLATGDGNQHTNLIAMGETPDITYGALDPGASETGLVIFEIPEDAVVQWLLMSPTIFVGENLVFVN